MVLTIQEVLGCKSRGFLKMCLFVTWISFGKMSRQPFLLGTPSYSNRSHHQRRNQALLVFMVGKSFRKKGAGSLTEKKI